MAEIINIGSGLQGENVHIFEDKRTYLIDNHLIPKNGYLVKIRLYITQLGGPLKLYILRRNRKGIIKIRDKTTITPNVLGDHAFSVQNGSLKVMKITKKDFIGVYIPEGGSLLAFKDKNKDRIIYKKNRPDSDKKEKKIKKLALKMRAKVSMQKTAFEIVDQAKGNFLINFNNGNYEIGDFTKNSFKCVIKAQKYDENTWYQIEYNTNNILFVNTEVEDDITKKITIKLDDTQEEIDKFVIYPHEETALNKDGALEYEIHFAQQPSSNKIRFNLDFNNIEFFPQPAYDQQIMSQEDIDSGIDYRTATEGRIGGPTGKLVVKNPIENVDSIALYKIDRNSFQKDEDEENAYGIGKVGNIERIKITDSLNNTVWGEQETKYNETQQQWKYIITIPQSFLDTAVYPIIIDPTFGYSTLGGSSWAIEDVIVGYIANPGEYGCCCDLYVGLDYWLSPTPIKMGLYDNALETLLQPQSIERNEGHAVEQFEQFPVIPLVGGGIFIEDKPYIVAAFLGGDVDIQRDQMGIVGTSKYVMVPYDGWPLNPSFSNSTWAYSTYGFYNQVTPQAWGIITQVTNNVFSPTYVMYMGGVSPDTPDMIARQIRVRVTLADPGQLAVALYVGGTLDNPTGAIKVTENYAVPAVAGWNNIQVNPVMIPNNSVIWVGVAINDGNEIYYSPNSTDSGDFQSIRGNWRDTLPANHDTNTPLPINPQPGSFESNYLQINVLFTIDPNIRGEINTSIQNIGFNALAYRGYLGEIDATLEEIEFNATGTPIKLGIVDATLEEIEFNGIGIKTISGIIDAMLDEIEFNATGKKFTSGIIDATLEEIEFNATGSKRLAGFINSTLDQITALINGIIINRGQINTVLESIEFSGIGIKTLSGEINTVLEFFMFNAEGINFAPKRGTLDITLDEIEFDAIGIVSEKTKGTIEATLDEIEFNGIGIKTISGIIDAMLDEIEFDATGKKFTSGIIDATLEEIEFNATGTPIKLGIVDATLEEIEFNAQGIKYYTGHIHQTLPNIQFNAVGGRQTTGNINTTLEQIQIKNFNGIVISRPISISLIKFGIKKAVQCAFNGPVVWERNDFPQPAIKYISLDITLLNTYSFDDPYIPIEGSPNLIEYIGNRFYQVRITAHSDGEDDPMAILEDVRDYIRDSNSCKYVELAKSSYIEAISINNLTGIDNIRNVGRAQMDVIFRTYAQYRRDVSYINQVDFTGKFYVGNGEFKIVNSTIKE